ncbi:MAG: hypothetical protein JNL08_17600 [Planctomycetes bacterium]|nr:hypothetical protein [Planctomycetota bacterium]
MLLAVLLTGLGPMPQAPVGAPAWIWDASAAPDQERFFRREFAIAELVGAALSPPPTFCATPQPIRVPVADVVAVAPSPLSPMPAGLVNGLSAAELRQLLAFLLSRGEGLGPAGGQR